MKRILFVDTHIGSGCDHFCEALESHPRVQRFDGDRTYDNPASLLAFADLPHKCTNSSAIYMDVIVHNHIIAHRDIYGIPYHIFVIRNPEESISILGEQMSWGSAARYYQMRLRRLISIARRAKHGLFFKHDELGEAYEMAANMLSLHGHHIEPLPASEVLPEAPYQFVVACQDSYARCVYTLRGLFPLT